MNIGVDLDGMLFAFPEFFSSFFKAMQHSGNKVGILTGRKDSDKDKILEGLGEMGIKPDFFIGMPDDQAGKVPQGIYKGIVCKEANINLLFDDFLTSDPSMIADFFSVNNTTVPFTSWAYDPEQDH